MTNKRKSEELAIPDISEDPAERKRLLNVLAQRRYRRRKRERLESLQAQVETHSQSSEKTSEDSPLSRVNSQSSAASQSPEVQDHWQNGFPGAVSEPELTSATRGISSQMSVVPDIWSPSQLFSLLSPSLSPQVFQDSISPPEDSLSGLSPPALLLEPFAQNQRDSEDQDSHFPARYEHRPTLSDQLQTHQSSAFTFLDNHLLEIPCLSLMNAAMRIAVRLNIKDTLWDITAISPFYQGPRQNSLMSLTPESTMSKSSSETSSSGDQQDTDSMDVNSLPPHYRPTPSQRLIPHHPVLDLLPWPTARDKLIQVFTLPVALRPKVAQDPMGVFRFVYDMEDESGEGLRIGGPDPFDLRNSEIGQVVFERWWWAFDVEVVEHSNRARRKRGQKGLSLGLAEQG